MQKHKITNYRRLNLLNYQRNVSGQVDLKTRICAFLSADVYKEHRIYDVVYHTDFDGNLSKWIIVEEMHDKDISGFDAYVYFNYELTQFIISFRGTELKYNKQGYMDLKTDFEMLREKTMKQYLTAYKFVKDFIVEKISSGKILSFKFNPETARQNLIITGHSLGGSIAQLIGAQAEFINVRIDTFNPLGMAEYLYRYNVWSKQELKKSKPNESLNEIYSKNFAHPYKFSYQNKKDYTNITNYITTRDFVGAVYDHIGQVRIVKLALQNRIKIKDIFLITPALKKMCKGHNCDNFIMEKSFDITKNPFNYQNFVKPLRVLQGDKVTKNVIAPIINLFL